MATEVAPPTRWLADEWEHRCGYASAVLSGIVPDARHKDAGGYHCSVLDLVAYGNAGDYSNRRALDKAPPVTAAGKKYGAAVDMSLSRADMRKLYGRALAVYSNRSDPRRRYLNAINVWDGVDGHAPRRLDFQANTNSTASKDHEWHSHEDQPRAYVDVNRSEQEAWTAARAFISMVKGETVSQWLTSTGEDDMSEEAEGQIHSLFTGFFFGGSSMGRSIDPDGAGAAKAGNSLVAKLDYVMLLLDKVAARAGMTPAELEQARAAAREGAQAGVVAAADEMAAAVVAMLPAGTLTREDVEQAVRDAFAGGLAPDADR